MSISEKQRVLVCTKDTSLQNELRCHLKAWFEVDFVPTFELTTKALQTALRHALIADLPAPGPAAVGGQANGKQALLDYFESCQSRFPLVRRVVVTDHCDLSLVIHGLHTGSIDSLVYRPIAINDLVPALRPARLQAAGNRRDPSVGV